MKQDIWNGHAIDKNLECRRVGIESSFPRGYVGGFRGCCGNGVMKEMQKKDEEEIDCHVEMNVEGRGRIASWGRAGEKGLKCRLGCVMM